jgi:IclR family transcriptional regulator, KDG regulon repressor
MNDPKNNYNIAVVARTLDVLEVLSRADDPQGVSEIARAIGATKSATFRIIATLEARGYLWRDNSGKFRLGIRLVELGQSALAAIDLRTIARPILADLHCQFNETVNFGIEDHDRIIYVDMIESDHGLRLSARIGGQDLIHSTAIGKAIMAHWPQSRIDEFLSRPLEPRTPRTLIDPGELRENLERIRRSGFSRDRGENEEGASCFGAPVFDHRGEVVGAISVSGPDSRMIGEKAEDIAVAVRVAAQELTTRLGGRMNAPAPRAQVIADIES